MCTDNFNLTFWDFWQILLWYNHEVVFVNKYLEIPNKKTMYLTTSNILFVEVCYFHGFVFYRSLRDTIVSKVWEHIPEWGTASKNLRLATVVFFLFLAAVSIILSFLPVGYAAVQVYPEYHHVNSPPVWSSAGALNHQNPSSRAHVISWEQSYSCFFPISIFYLETLLQNFIFVLFFSPFYKQIGSTVDLNRHLYLLCATIWFQFIKDYRMSIVYLYRV